MENCEKCKKNTENIYSYKSYVYRIAYKKICWICYNRLMNEDMEWEGREDSAGHELCTRHGDY